MMNSLHNSSYYQSLPTAGAVAVTNEKGEKTMQKVKVHRYITGRRPRYAPTKSDSSSSASESSDDEFIDNKLRTSASRAKPVILTQMEIKPEPDNDDIQADMNDRRLRRLMSRREVKDESDEELRNDRNVAVGRHARHVAQPQVLKIGDNEVNDERIRRRNRREADDEESEDNEVEDEDNVERRHALLRIKKEEEEEELLDKDDDEEAEEEEESEYEEYTDSEDDNGPRLKPVFVRKKERVTIQEKEKEELKAEKEEELKRKMGEERKRQTLKMIEDDIRREEAEKEEADEEEQIKRGIASILTDDESEETAYETWKLRELKRIKRDKDEREAMIREKFETERLRNMSEQERQEELKRNPREITNQAVKGKYKFLQKYFHRGAFYLDEDDTVFKRDFAQPTLEDHFDRTILPKVMQVKNFGRSGRTKYTHLVDQDTTAFDSPWGGEPSAQTVKFHSQQAGGMKQVFERPSRKRK